MAKETKKSAAKSAAQQAAAQQAPASNAAPKVEVKTPEIKKGLSPDAKAQYLASVQTERAFMMNNAEKPSAVLIDGLSQIAQATILDIALTELAAGSATGYIIAGNEKNYNIFCAMALENGVTLPSFKSLPAPSKEDLARVGLAGIDGQAKLLTVSTENVSKETIEKKKQEKKVAESAKTTENPAEIENEEQLKASLTALLVKPITQGTDRPDARVQRTIKFYRGYLTIQANKKENKAEEINKVKNMSRQEMLNSIAEIVGPCPFALTGTAYFLRKRTAETGSPISAFCLYRRSAVPESNGTIDDAYLADVVRILLIWSCNSQIAEAKETIAAMERQMKKETGSAKTASETVIRAKNMIIAELNDVIAKITNPSLDIVDSLIDNYKSEKTDSEEYKLAHRIVSNIMDTYYPEYKDKNLDEDVMLKNVQQRAGIIVNMFRDPLAQSPNYAEANITDMVEVEKPAEKN